MKLPTFPARRDENFWFSISLKNPLNFSRKEIENGAMVGRLRQSPSTLADEIGTTNLHD